MAAAEATAGRMAGQVTLRKARHRDAPEHACGLLGARVEALPQAPDGADHDGVVEEGVGEQDRHARCRAGPRRASPAGPSSDEERRPDHDGREHERHDEQRLERGGARGTRRWRARGRPGRPISRVSTVDAAACQSVNQATCRSSASPSTSPTPRRSHPCSPRRPSPTMLATGQAKKQARNATGRRQQRDRPPRRVTGARCRSTGRSSPPGWRRSPPAGARTRPSGVAACSTNTSGSSTPSRAGKTNIDSGTSACTVSDSRKSMSWPASSSCSVPARMPAPSTCR